MYPVLLELKYLTKQLKHFFSKAAETKTIILIHAKNLEDKDFLLRWVKF